MMVMPIIIIKISPEASINVNRIFVHVDALIPTKLIRLTITMRIIAKITTIISREIPIKSAKYPAKPNATVAAERIPEKIIIQPKINDKSRILKASSVYTNSAALLGYIAESSAYEKPVKAPITDAKYKS